MSLSNYVLGPLHYCHKYDLQHSTLVLDHGSQDICFVGQDLDLLSIANGDKPFLILVWGVAEVHDLQISAIVDFVIHNSIVPSHLSSAEPSSRIA